MEVSAFSCHGNPIHPNKELAAAYDKDMRNAVLMAEKYGLHQINCFSGCPGACETTGVRTYTAKVTFEDKEYRCV